MKFHFACLSLILASADAFAPRAMTTTTTVTVTQPSTKSALRMSSTDEVTKLRAQAAKMREDASRLAKELGKDDDGGVAKGNTGQPAKVQKTEEELASAIGVIDFAGPAQNQISALDALRKDGTISLYKSATVEAKSGDLRAFPVSLQMLEQRSGLTSQNLGIGVEEVSLDDFKYATLYVTGGCSIAGVAALAFLPENVGATICYVVALIPILFLAVGSTAPAAIANVIASLKGKEDSGVAKADRVCRHEAAHFLCGYLCGLPIAEYATNEDNIPRVEFHDTAQGPATAQRELTEEEVNSLTVVAMSGSVAEAMEFGTAEGANSDLIGLEMVFRRSEKFMGAEKQQDMTRWGALTAHRLLNLNKGRLDKLVQAFAAQRSVAECVRILEQH